MLMGSPHVRDEDQLDDGPTGITQRSDECQVGGRKRAEDFVNFTVVEMRRRTSYLYCAVWHSVCLTTLIKVSSYPNLTTVCLN